MSIIPTCSCIGCNAVGTHKVDADRRGGRSAWFCDVHARKLPYGTRNNSVQGSRKVNAIQIGVEMETSLADEKARIELLLNGYIPTSDCSIRDTEYVSGIMQGLNKISKQCVTFDRLIENGHMVIGNECGTHLHVSIGDMTADNGDSFMAYICRFYNSLFVPVTEAMEENPEAVKRIFGRYFCNYAPEINMHTQMRAGNHNDRYAWINATNSSNIEYRLCKFVSGKQYMAAVKLCVAMTKTVVTNFCEHFNDSDFDRSRYADITAYRKHKASVTAKKLVKLFNDAAESI